MQTLTPRTSHITRIWRSMDEPTKQEGCNWYGQARTLAAELDPSNAEKAGAVIALNSQQRSWPMNMVLARRAYAAYRDGATIDQLCELGNQPYPVLRKTALVLHGADPWDVVKGQKVTSFWHSISHPHLAASVTVDRHAFDISVGRVTDDQTRRILERKGVYESIADLYRRAADILSKEEGRVLLPSDIQAGTWIWWRVNRAVAYHG